MINLSIEKARDTDRTGNYIFQKNLIYIGSNHDADIYGPTEHIKANHIFIEVAQNQLLVHPGRGVEYILINQKRTTSFKKLKIGDTIEIGELKLKISDYRETSGLNLKEVLKRRVQEIEANDPELTELIKVFGDEL